MADVKPVTASTFAPLRGAKRWEFLERARTIRFATANEDGSIYLSPLWLVVHERRIFIPVDAASKHGANFEAGRQLGRLSPFDHSLPRELANRVPNKGMEGLTITPNGRMLVGIMQSALQQPDLTKKPGNVAPLLAVEAMTIALRPQV